jgi:choline dehydrogenase-like flavoprotein
LDYRQDRLPPALDEHRRLVASFSWDLFRSGAMAFSQRTGIAGTAHANGTLIAGAAAQSSVVDGHGRVHGLASLYVVDASILPRASRVNPSLTVYAWSLRVAANLARELSARA